MAGLERGGRFPDSVEARDALMFQILSHLRNKAVMNAFDQVDRKDFVPPGSEELAYKNEIIQLGDGSSISQPTLVAEMLDLSALTGEEIVLEVGTCSGYSAAVTSCCAKKVYTIEHDPELAKGARERLGNLGYENVEVVEGDGALGLPDKGPFDSIIVTAGLKGDPRNLETYRSFLNQLNPVFGRLVVPVGTDPKHQYLTVVTAINGSVGIARGERVTFVPLMSDQKGGWTKEEINKVTQHKLDIINSIMEKHNLSFEEVKKGMGKILDLPFPDEFSAEDLSAYLSLDVLEGIGMKLGLPIEAQS